MAGEERVNVIIECFHRLHNTGVTAVSLTCDGPSCHFSMIRSLGANMEIDGLDPSSSHPADSSKKVHVILDVRHMLKLLRNLVDDGGVFRTSDGNTLKWHYI